MRIKGSRKEQRIIAYYLVEALQIPHYRLGRLIRFKLSDIENWMKTKKYNPLNFNAYSDAAEKL